MKQSLYRPQRAVLANAIVGRRLYDGLRRTREAVPLSTAPAPPLHRKGMLAAINHLPTAAGRRALGSNVKENFDRIVSDGQVSNNDPSPT